MIGRFALTAYKSELLNELSRRGFIHQATDEGGLDALAAKGRIIAYNGFDLTAESLHVGNLFPIMMLRWMQKTGHKPIVLLGGGTTRVGDPSGKDEIRKLLGEEQIQANKAGIKKVFTSFLTFGDGPTDALIVDNDEWLSSLGYISFLRDYGRHFTINRMLTFDSVKSRLERERPLSFTEFNYMLLQAYDFVELNRRYGCVLQTGGSDQWSNIVNGVELGQRCAAAELFGLTSPSPPPAARAVWLNADMLSPYEYWQFWRNAEDADVGLMLKAFTELPLDEIARLEALQGGEINEAKKVLATEAAALLHGRAAALSAAETARRAFEQGGAAEGLPTVAVPMSELKAGLGVLAAFVRAGLAASNSDARRHIRGNAVRVNDEPVNSDKAVLTDAQLQGGHVKLSLGKKKHVLLRPE